ncbi:Nuclease precursor [compost metagenome]
MGSIEAMAQSFSLANMAPQDVELNNGAWNDIEQDTRRYVQRAQGGVYIFTGPVYAAPAETIGRSEVHVPQYFYKLVYDPSNGKSWAHWQANEPQARVSPPISYEELVRRTGIEFVPR